jgi:hypothetical protein
MLQYVKLNSCEIIKPHSGCAGMVLYRCFWLLGADIACAIVNSGVRPIL